MSTIFQKAAERYRVRVLRVDAYEDDDFSLDWGRSVIYSGRSSESFQGTPVNLATVWQVEIVDGKEGKVVRTLEAVPSRTEAQHLCDAVRSDAEHMTVHAFEAQYYIL